MLLNIFENVEIALVAPAEIAKPRYNASGICKTTVLAIFFLQMLAIA